MGTKTVPPYGFVHLDSCEGAVTAAFANAFDVANHTDRALLGWRTVCYDSTEQSMWVRLLWQYLREDETVQSAVTIATVMQEPGSDPWLYGAPASKVKWVYGGLPGEWWRK